MSERGRLFAVASLLALLTVGCGWDYQAPPGGEDSYCYRIEWHPDQRGDRWLFYTNEKPVWLDGDSLLIEDAWYGENGSGPGNSIRFDRHADRAYLTRLADGNLRVLPYTARCELNTPPTPEAAR